MRAVSEPIRALLILNGLQLLEAIQWNPFYCGHLGNLVKRPVYSGNPLLWTPWGPGEMSCIQWNPSIANTLGTW